jgi:hypothetical protein
MDRFEVLLFVYILGLFAFVLSVLGITILFSSFKEPAWYRDSLRKKQQ